MKPDYKNWVPAGMLAGLISATVAAGILFVLFGVAGIGVGGTLRLVLAIVFGLALLALCGVTAMCTGWYRAFSYTGKRQVSKRIVEGVAGYVTLPEGGRGLDVGCGSGALIIACAKRNPQGSMLGVDRWGKDYASFSRALCERNAGAEGVRNASFVKGNALKLDFPDESFDAVTSNYVYHNITGVDRKELLLETLRVLKKGGVFAIHDIMTPGRYGDMEAFAGRLRRQGYESVQLVDTSEGLFIEGREAKFLGLRGSMLLVGKK